VRYHLRLTSFKKATPYVSIIDDVMKSFLKTFPVCEKTLELKIYVFREDDR